MATTGNNGRVPEELLAQMEAAAREKGKSADELVTDALKRYLANEWMNRLEREGQERRRQLGLKTDDDVERYVDKAITEQRGR
jgi:metal-responsive CopG/Arc/MetJ family transcriptional regulator